jgi:hypothetical protein
MRLDGARERPGVFKTTGVLPNQTDLPSVIACHQVRAPPTLPVRAVRRRLCDDHVLS